MPAHLAAPQSPPSPGRIDVHAHLLPDVDDGCKTVEDSIACARRMVEAGYAHLFCTPHVWPSLPHNSADEIPGRVADLQAMLDAVGVPLTLHPGGEMNLRPETVDDPADAVVSYGMRGKVVLFDLWADRLPDFFRPAVRHLQSGGVTCVLAHPERMRAVQLDPGLIGLFTDELGLRLQGNLQCFANPVGSMTRTVADGLLRRGAYWVLGSDLHNPRSLDVRLEGLRNAIRLVGDEAVDRLTVTNPRELLAPPAD
ncbi:MAG: hypothetical protein JWO31_3828 [Phycisphaerales bacterium]|nr:hypothetical protein [Phycisphaerales bacterium]